MRYTTFVLVAALAGGGLALMGCDDDGRVLERKETVDVDNGKVERDTETVKQERDGTIIKEETEEKREIDR